MLEDNFNKNDIDPLEVDDVLYKKWNLSSPQNFGDKTRLLLFEKEWWLQIEESKKLIPDHGFFHDEDTNFDINSIDEGFEILHKK